MLKKLKNRLLCTVLNIPNDIINAISSYYLLFSWDKNTSNKSLEIIGNRIKAKHKNWKFGFSIDYISYGNICWKIKNK